MDLILSGIGKIARDQHIPAIAGSGDWSLRATHSRSGQVDGVEPYQELEKALAAHPDVSVWSLCQPPVPRYEIARALIEAGKHVMLEKPPGASLAEVYDLAARAERKGVTLFTTWHSRMAMAVAQTKERLATSKITKLHITWREDVRRWHPGQDWVFEPGGMGVFDPGINALSILTEILPEPVHVTSAVLEYPENRATPIAAQIEFGPTISADFDWRQEGPQTWEIEIETQDATYTLKDGGAVLNMDGEPLPVSGLGEYPALYAHMAQLVREGRSDVDLSPMIHVADAFSLARRRTVAPFHF